MNISVIKLQPGMFRHRIYKSITCSVRAKLWYNSPWLWLHGYRTDCRNDNSSPISGLHPLGKAYSSYNWTLELKGFHALAMFVWLCAREAEWLTLVLSTTVKIDQSWGIPGAGITERDIENKAYGLHFSDSPQEPQRTFRATFLDRLSLLPWRQQDSRWLRKNGQHHCKKQTLQCTTRLRLVVPPTCTFWRHFYCR